MADNKKRAGAQSNPLDAFMGAKGRSDRELREVLLDEIIEPDDYRLPPKEDTGLRGLASSIENRGLKQPIGLRPVEGGYKIIWGRRRYASVKLWTERSTITAFIERQTGDVEARADELIENLERLELNAKQRAEASAEYEKILHEMKVKETVGRPRKRAQDEPNKTRPMTNKEIAETRGVSLATQKREAKIGRRLVDETSAILEGTGYDNSITVLDELVTRAQDPEIQVEIAQKLADTPGLKATQACRLIRKEVDRIEHPAVELSAAEIFKGDFQHVLPSHVANGTVDVIFTAATRDARKVHLYEDLAQEAVRSLAEDGLMFVFTEIRDARGEPLEERARAILRRHLELVDVLSVCWRSSNDWTPVSVWRLPNSSRKHGLNRSYFVQSVRSFDSYGTFAFEILERLELRPDAVVVDPMCRRGAIPIEAMKLGLQAIGVDMKGFDVDEARKHVQKELLLRRRATK